VFVSQSKCFTLVDRGKPGGREKERRCRCGRCARLQHRQGQMKGRLRGFRHREPELQFRRQALRAILVPGAALRRAARWHQLKSKTAMWC